ncbi:SDR family NAD(P)-dependent oxidoreductase [Isoalcanivorax indicus]|uniref:SDR family NAD(P)-dependent oxidoreductase n=1 Tax=Isoalcanivorax indicus TaxID=2202653 RepID=UPI000DBA0E93|nr:SDR family oxidoreductase [Isoalcanivorax indicus]
MHAVITGASQGLGRALVEGLGQAGDRMTGVSRGRPATVRSRVQAQIDWIPADLSEGEAASKTILSALGAACPDVLICNVGIWEPRAFEDDYDFLSDAPDMLRRLVDINITSTLLLCQALLPRLLTHRKSHIILIGSTSGRPHAGRPEVAFGASKHALNGMADALREGFRQRGLAVTCLHPGYLATGDEADASQIPLQDVVSVLRCALSLSEVSFVREVVMPALADVRF